MPEGAANRLYLVPGAPPQAPRALDDGALVQAFLRGEGRASSEIWDRFHPLVRRILFRAVGPGHDVDDLAQEVFLRLYRKLPSLRDPGSLRSFVLAITTRVVQGELRVRWVRRWLGLFDDGEMPERPSDDADLEAREALDRFYRILDRLSPKHRAAFVLRYVEGLELADVADALDVSLATIKRWLPRISKRVFMQAERDPVLAPYLSPDGPLVVVHG